MVTQVSGRFPDRGGRRLLQGQAPRSGSQTGRGGWPPSVSFGSQAGRGNRSREEIRRPIC